MPDVAENEKGRLIPDNSGPVPCIIPRSEHQVSRKNIDREALKVLYRLRDAGFTAYLVGGGVRDLYLGKTPKDFDISTDARPGQIRKLFKNSRLIGRRFRLVQVFFRGNKIIEVSTFRRRSEFDLNGGSAADDSAQVLAANNTYGTPADDAFRRDLTINALFYEINTFSIIDYTGGVADLDNGIIRIIGDPDKRIRRDPVRIMRVIRHAARNNFTIEEGTWQAARRHCQEIKLCPISRIRDELMKDLRSGASRAWAELAIDSDLFSVLFPFYTPVLRQPATRHNCRELLMNMLTVIDKLHQQPTQGHLPEHILWTLFMLPWAVDDLNIMNTAIKRKDTYRFSRGVRERLDKVLNHLSVRRSVKEEVAMIMANIHLFKKFQDNIPKWLKKKSYYPDCKRLYTIYREIHNSGDRISHEILDDLGRAVKKEPEKAGRAGRQRRQGRPAFSGRSRTGIFGLKKSKHRA
jgi:poly(A) polymerase